MNENKRNYGIDILRIIAMTYVVILHCLGHGGRIMISSTVLRDYKISRFLEIFVYSAVDIFGIISGYVMCDKKIKYSNLIIIWVEVVFYSLIITIIYDIYNPTLVTISDYIKAIMPISFRYYWYITAYFGMMLLAPLIQKGTNELSKINARRILFVIIIFFSIIESVFNIFQLNNGYSVIWLLILFLIGILIKKSDFKIKKFYLFINILFLTIFTWYYCFYGFESNNIIVFNKQLFLSYVSPTVLINAISYLLLFKSIKFNDFINKIIKYFSPSALAIYLLNDNPLIRVNLIYKRFVKYYEKGEGYMLLQILLFTILFVILSLIIDKIRIYLFKRINIKKNINKLGID